MNDSSTKDTLEVEVTDFGPIARARIDLRPLTVFVGPSNTGKSYLAVLIYALHRHFNRHRREMRYWHPEKRPALRDALTDWMQAINEGRESVEDGRIAFPDPLREEIRGLLHEQGAYLRDELCRCFGLGGIRSLTRKGSRQTARIVLRRQPTPDSLLFEQAFSLATKGLDDVRTVLSEDLSSPADESVPIGDDLKEIDYLRRQARVMEPMVVRENEARWNAFSWDIMEHLAGVILPQIVGKLHAPAHYLPADRTGIMRTYRVLRGLLIERVSQSGYSDSLPDLLGVVGDFLDQLGQFGDLANLQNVGMPECAARMEQAMLKGSVDIETSPTSTPSFFYRPDGWKKALALMHASSTVSELAPIILYLRHVIKPNDVLIIDEPEAHLHPAMQAEFTRQLAALVHARVRVLITTHSEWVLERVANLVRLSGLSKVQRKEITGDDLALDPDQVGAWLFKSGTRPKGSVVEELELDTETGLFQTDFDLVGEMLYNEGIRISNQLMEDGKA